ncbi:MAG: o-succinylbenzoate synthase [Nostocaceae cyanobacterium]|nr:o-succinylbenzoate synthase [Nostocaceae cyanobacterium]
MSYHWQFRPYRYPFKHPLHTSHGVWNVREGIILRLEQSGRVGWGEIAPLSWFGSETLEQAEDFCRQLITKEVIPRVPDELPACQFAVESAWEMLSAKDNGSDSLSYSALLPAGAAALDRIMVLLQQGYRTFKWKIGVGDVDTELKIFAELVQVLPNDAKLRLDGNGGLGLDGAKAWLEAADKSKVVEFIEQPLGIDQFSAMLALSQQYQTLLALDESVATLAQMQNCYELGWRSVFVIKPAIAGSPSSLRQFCQTTQIDAVFSSVFETKIGRVAALRLAAELSHPKRAIGFGVDHWFDFEQSPEQIWQDL